MRFCGLGSLVFEMAIFITGVKSLHFGVSTYSDNGIAKQRNVSSFDCIVVINIHRNL